MRVERLAEGVEVVLGDCREYLATLADGSVDAVVTDPPYNVGFAYMGDASGDRKENYADWCEKWFSELRRVSPVVAISCGLANIGLWSSIEKPLWILSWHKPAAMGRCPVGFNNWEPVLVYGKLPRQICDVFKAMILPDDSLEGHPCPKPIQWGMWQVENFTDDGDTVLDCFVGSGTVGVACARLGRKFIGIEQEPVYFDIACRRITAALNEQPLFAEQERESQPDLFEQSA